MVDEQLGLVKSLEERPEQDLTFIKIIFKLDLLQLVPQTSLKPS